MRCGRKTRIWNVVWAVAALGVVAAPASAQWDRHDDRDDREWGRGPSAYLNIAFLGADPVGEFERNVDNGFGLGLASRFPVSGAGPLALRLDGGFMIYGHERRDLCFPVPVGCRIGIDLNTYNTIAFLGVGPELAGPGPVSPYINGTFGLTWFYTNSSLSGDDDWDEDFNTVNYSDWVTALRVGGGVRFTIAGAPWRPVQLDIGAQYHRNGVADYLREGDIVDLPDGSIELYPIRSETNMVVFNVGVALPIGGGGDRYDDRYDDRDRRRRR
ncbi:MAG: hypothetical protein KJO11_11985 [Gemmatimonadetes bacterium]|nr:hypothetical protein [Gemmatimonadota bacterium]NNF37202.1 hypothetical protein [Gemmatimonadota bacterium]